MVFLIKEEIHTLLRRAAFDHRITMQEVLRRGLKMWLVAQGYKFPEQAAGAAARNQKRDQTTGTAP